MNDWTLQDLKLMSSSFLDPSMYILVSIFVKMLSVLQLLFNWQLKFQNGTQDTTVRFPRKRSPKIPLKATVPQIPTSRCCYSHFLSVSVWTADETDSAKRILVNQLNYCLKGIHLCPLSDVRSFKQRSKHWGWLWGCQWPANCCHAWRCRREPTRVSSSFLQGQSWSHTCSLAAWNCC